MLYCRCIKKSSESPCLKRLCHKCNLFLYNKQMTEVIESLCRDGVWYSHDGLFMVGSLDDSYIIKTDKKEIQFKRLDQAISYIYRR